MIIGYFYMFILIEFECDNFKDIYNVFKHIIDVIGMLL